MTEELIERLREQNERLSGWMAGIQMNAHQWMVAHDKLKAGKPYDLPKPADLPDALQSLSARVAELEGENKRHLERLRQYQSHLQIVPMLLGPKAWELWRGWVDKEWLPTMLYQHYSWGPKAYPGDGESIAEMLLKVRDELASGECRPVDLDV